MRKIHLFPLAALVLLSLPAAAQFRDLKVNLPFAFQVGDDALPSGTYTFAQETRNDKMEIRGGKKRLMIPTSVLPPQDIFSEAKTTLIFHRAGNKYFLRQLWTKHIGYEMPTSAEEKEVARSEPMAEVKVNVKMR